MFCTNHKGIPAGVTGRFGGESIRQQPMRKKKKEIWSQRRQLLIVFLTLGSNIINSNIGKIWEIPTDFCYETTQPCSAQGYLSCAPGKAGELGWCPNLCASSSSLGTSALTPGLLLAPSHFQPNDGCCCQGPVPPPKVFLDWDHAARVEKPMGNWHKFPTVWGCLPLATATFWSHCLRGWELEGDRAFPLSATSTFLSAISGVSHLTSPALQVVLQEHNHLDLGPNQIPKKLHFF